MQPSDFQKVFELIEDSSELMRFMEGLSAEDDLNVPCNCWGSEDRQIAEGLDQIYDRWRVWLEDDQMMGWHEDLGRYVGADPLSYIKGELRLFLEHFPDYLGLCENCDRFFVKSLKRGGKRRQRFCKRNGRACRDEYYSKKRKTPEFREKRRGYMRTYRQNFRVKKREPKK
jgi:hypothetical protein